MRFHLKDIGRGYPRIYKSIEDTPKVSVGPLDEFAPSPGTFGDVAGVDALKGLDIAGKANKDLDASP